MLKFLTLTNFSDSPLHLDAKLETETLKKVVCPFYNIYIYIYIYMRHTVARALASMVFPVPGGPNMSTPFQGALIPVK